MTKLIIITFLLIAQQSTLFGMEPTEKIADQELAALTDRDRMVHDFLHDHERFKAQWGQLPDEIGCAIAQKAIGLSFAMLKKEIGSPAKELYGGHKQEIASAKFDPTGTLLLTASNKAAKIWQVATRDCMHTFKHDNHCNLHTAKFNRSGNLMVTQGDYTLVWDVATKTCLHTLPFDKIETAKFNYTDDSMVITLFEDYDAIIYDMATGATHILKHDHEIYAAKFNRPGSLIATSGGLGTSIGIVKVWDVANKLCVETFHGAGPVLRAKFNHKGNMIAILHYGMSELNVHDCLAKTCFTLKHDSPIGSIQFSHADDMIVTSGSHTSKIWDIKTGTCVRTLRHDCSTHSMKFNQTDDLLITYSDNTIKVWDVKTGACLHTKEDLWARRAKINQTGDLFVTTLMNGSAKIWDIGNYLAAIKFIHKSTTLEQAMLLNCIYRVALQNRLFDMKYFWEEELELKLDFNQFPHLQEYFMQLPEAIQQGLKKYVVLKKDEVHDTLLC